MLGLMLVLAVLSVLCLSVLFGLQDKVKEDEVYQRLLEMELRECEVNMDLSELRNDIARLIALQKYEATRSVVPLETVDQDPKQQSTETVDSDRDGSASPMLARWRYTQGERRLARLAKKSKTSTSFEFGRYPCYVLSLTHLTVLTTLPEHEDMLDVLEILTPSSLAPSSAFAFFISQNWETFGEHPHPDNSRSTKLNWLKNIRTHLGIVVAIPEIWIWWCVSGGGRTAWQPPFFYRLFSARQGFRFCATAKPRGAKECNFELVVRNAWAMLKSRQV